MQLDALPATSMHVGACGKRADELLAFNGTRDTMYELNVNDCRHYVNDLVRETTGAPPFYTLLRVSLGAACLCTHRAKAPPVWQRV